MPVSLSAIKNFTGAPKAPSCPFPVLTSKKVTTTLTSKSRFPEKQTLRLPCNWDWYLWEGRNEEPRTEGRGGKRRREGGNKETWLCRCGNLLQPQQSLYLTRREVPKLRWPFGFIPSWSEGLYTQSQDWGYNLGLGSALQLRHFLSRIFLKGNLDGAFH